MTNGDFQKRAIEIFTTRYPKSILYKRGKKLEKINKELLEFIFEAIGMYQELVVDKKDEV